MAGCVGLCKAKRRSPRHIVRVCWEYAWSLSCRVEYEQWPHKEVGSARGIGKRTNTLWGYFMKINLSRLCWSLLATTLVGGAGIVGAADAPSAKQLHRIDLTG